MSAGESVGRFRVLDLVGQGGMGVVYRALDPELQREVALKFLSVERSRDSASRLRFQREAQAAAQLDCGSVAAVYDTGEHQGRAWIAMAFCTGGSLAERLHVGPLGWDDTLAVLSQLIAGLGAAHRAGIVHRDVKPANIMLSESVSGGSRSGGAPRVKLVDFGLARIESATALTRSDQTPGTLLYMAPEQLRGESVDHRVDIWALGVVIVEMITGRRPFEGKMGFSVVREILDGEPELDGVPDFVQPLVRRCLAKDPAARYPHVEALDEELQSILDRQKVAPTSSDASAGNEPAGSDAQKPDLPAPASFRRPREFVWGLAFLLLMAGVLIASRPPAWLTGVEPAQPPRRVALAMPQLVSTDVGDTETGEATATAVRLAMWRLLVSLDGIRAVSADHLPAGPMDPAEQARSLGADTILSSRIECEPDGCDFEASLIDADGVLAWTDATRFPVGDRRLAARAAAASVRRAFAEHAVQGSGLDFEMDGEDFETLVRLSRSYATRSMPFETLLDELAALRQRAPNIIDIHLLEGRAALMAYHDSRDPAWIERGFELMEQAADLAPWDLAPLLLRFDLALVDERLDEAEQVLERIEASRPGEPGALQRRAQLAEQLGDSAAALEFQRSAVQLSPSWQRLQTLANMELRLGFPEDARHRLERLLAKSPNNYSGLRLLAQLEMQTGNLERADTLYDRLVVDPPEFADVMNQGVARLLLRRYEKAEENFRQALALNDHAGILLNLARCVSLSGREQEAQGLFLQVLDRLAESGSGGWRLQLIEAQALAHLGRRSDAAAMAQSVFGKQPDSLQVAYELALVDVLVGDQASALANARRALEGGYGRIWFELEWFDELRRDPELAGLLSGPPDHDRARSPKS